MSGATGFCGICGAPRTRGDAEQHLADPAHVAAERNEWRGLIYRTLPGTTAAVLKRVKLGTEFAPFIDGVLAELAQEGEVRRGARGRWEVTP